MYMGRIEAELGAVSQRSKAVRGAAGAALIAAAVIIALPFWAALSVWLAAALLVKGMAAALCAGRDTLLFAGDLALGAKPALPRDR